MQFKRMPIEAESPEEMGYGNIQCNLAESSVADASLNDLSIQLPSDLLISYGAHRGDDLLREAIVADEASLNATQVLTTPGAAGALFLVSVSLLQAGDHMIVVRPNYATNIETPRSIGCDISYLDLTFEEGYRLDVQRIAALIKKETKLISITSPHNPTGVMVPQQDIMALATLAEENDCYLLVDETYRDLLPPHLRPDYAARMSQKVISVSSLSKAYGVPGIRTGWIISRDEHLMLKLLAAKEQIFICGSILDEAVALQVLNKREWILRRRMAPAIKNLSHLKDFIESRDWIEWVEPQGGVVAFPRIRPEIAFDAKAFYRSLYESRGTIVGPGHWFEQSPHYMRIGYGFPGEAEFLQGLENIELTFHEAVL